MMTSSPISFNFLTAVILPSFITSATAIIPQRFPSSAIYIGVFPVFASSSAFFRASSDISIPSISLRFPIAIFSSLILTTIPFPVIDSNSSIANNSSASFSAALTIASPSGCSLPFSAEAASCKRCFLSVALNEIISVTSGFPSVMVPVLSNIMLFILCVVSNASPPLIKIPFSAPFPVPTIIAVGVASPSAHGHAITSTDINIVREK